MRERAREEERPRRSKGGRKRATDESGRARQRPAVKTESPNIVSKPKSARACRGKTRAEDELVLEKNLENMHAKQQISKQAQRKD